MMPASASQPKHKHVIRNSILIVIAVVAVACGVFLGYKARVENQAHRKLMQSLEDVASAVKERGVSNASVSSGCGRPETGFGVGDTECAAVVETWVVDRSEYMNVISNYINVLTSSKSFTATKSLKRPMDDEQMMYGSAAYRHTGTQKLCGALYMYVDKPEVILDGRPAHYNVQFSCDDTSWFVKTFENGPIRL